MAVRGPEIRRHRAESSRDKKSVNPKTPGSVGRCDRFAVARRRTMTRDDHADVHAVARALAKAPKRATRRTAKALRALVSRRGALTFTDVEDDPARFFAAHRALATHATTLGPGFWIRFTVQYNLFAGTCAALGTEAQRARLETLRRRGTLGCFCLTERLAGVNSGLVVHTRADWDGKTGGYVINSGEGDGGTKNWISQGLTADAAVVVANLFVKGRSFGPHGFLVTMREGAFGRLARGITVGDMGLKTTGNDLDNAWVRFDDFRAPAESLLAKYGDVDASTGEYVAKKEGIRTMDMIGQRLFTGRVAVAQAALTFVRRLFDDTKRYSDQKPCTMRGDSPALTDVPQLRALYDEGYATIDRLDAYVKQCENELCQCLRRREIPDAVLVQAIAVAKIKAVEGAIDLAFRLKQEVGSYALMSGTGFDNTDFLQCCKFAEGDSRILSQKLARDCFGAFQRNDQRSAVGVKSEIELDLCQRIDEHMRDAREANANVSKIEAWDSAWREVYRLAEVICERVMHEKSFAAAAAAGSVTRSKL
jgi:alkylation response protein AidB-like acyl-CoA dehydrogenase